MPSKTLKHPMPQFLHPSHKTPRRTFAALGLCAVPDLGDGANPQKGANLGKPRRRTCAALGLCAVPDLGDRRTRKGANLGKPRRRM